jgi:hypothetical protein
MRSGPDGRKSSVARWRHGCTPARSLAARAQIVADISVVQGREQVANNSSGNGRTVNGAAAKIACRIGPNPQHDPLSHLVSLPTTVTT